MKKRRRKKRTRKKPEEKKKKKTSYRRVESVPGVDELRTLGENLSQPRAVAQAGREEDVGVARGDAREHDRKAVVEAKLVVVVKVFFVDVDDGARLGL